MDLPLSEVSSSVSNLANEGVLPQDSPKHPTPHLSPDLSTSDPVNPVAREPKVDSVEEEQDISHDANKLFVGDKRFFGPARSA